MNYRNLKMLIFLISPVFYCNMASAEGCFAKYANTASTSGYSSEISECIKEIETTTRSSESAPGGATSKIKFWENRSSSVGLDSTLSKLSEDATEVYYDDEFCGPSGSISSVPCRNLGRLARLKPSGKFGSNFDCRTRGHGNTNCPDFVRQMMPNFYGKCDENTNVAKNYCNEFLSAVLGSPRCQPPKTTADCLKVANTAFNPGDPEELYCTYSVYKSKYASSDRMGLCNTKLGTIAQAAEPINDAPEPGRGSGDETFSTASTEPAGGISEEQANEIAKTSEEVAQNLFGRPDQNLQYDRGNANGSTDVPGIDAQAQLQVSDSFQNSGSRTQGVSPVRPGKNNPDFKFPVQTASGPSAGGQAAAAAAGNPGGGFGGGAGGLGNVGAGGGNQAAGQPRRRPRYGAPRAIQEQADKSLNSFMSADGGSSPSGDPMTEAQLDPRIKAQIEKNKQKGPASTNGGTANMNNAFQRGLPNGGSGALPATMFEKYDNIYSEMRTSSDFLE